MNSLYKIWGEGGTEGMHPPFNCVEDLVSVAQTCRSKSGTLSRIQTLLCLHAMMGPTTGALLLVQSHYAHRIDADRIDADRSIDAKATLERFQRPSLPWKWYPTLPSVQG